MIDTEQAPVEVESKRNDSIVAAAIVAAALPWLFLFSKNTYIVLEVLLSLLAAYTLIFAKLSNRGTTVIRVFVIVYVALTVAATLSSAIPLEIKAQGYRKSALFVLTIWVGIAYARKVRKFLDPWVVLLFTTSVVIIAVLQESGVPFAQVTQRASDSTQHLGEIVRATSAFSGPFHLSIFAALILVYSITLRGALRTYGIACAAVLGYLSAVRSGIAFLVIFGILFLAYHLIKKKYYFLLAGFLPFALIAAYYAIRFSVDAVFEETRFTNRFENYQEAFELIRSNTGGYGLGSALDTYVAEVRELGLVSGQTHNFLVKIAFESGLVGAVIVAVILVVLLVRSWKVGNRVYVFGLAGILLTYGMVINVQESVPVSLMLALLIGAGSVVNIERRGRVDSP